jgi:hypothetical protein
MLTREELMQLASDMVEEFCLQCVLVRDNATREVFLLEGKLSHEPHQ